MTQCDDCYRRCTTHGEKCLTGAGAPRFSQAVQASRRAMKLLRSFLHALQNDGDMMRSNKQKQKTKKNIAKL